MNIVLQFLGCMFLICIILLVIDWGYHVTCKLRELEARLDKQDGTNRKFKLKKKYK